MMNEMKNDPWKFFEENDIKELLKKYHPDKMGGDDTIFLEVQKYYEISKTKKESIGGYTLSSHICNGDLRKVYKSGSNIVKINIVNTPTAKKLCENEVNVLDILGKDAILGKSVEKVVEYNPKDGFVVTSFSEKLTPLNDIITKFPTLDGRHVVWMMKRIMAYLGHMHKNGYVHCAVVPSHILIGSQSHSGTMCGNIHSVKRGKQVGIIPSAYKSMYPKWAKDGATPRLDSYLLAKSFANLSGLPKPLSNFLRGLETCDDLWEAHDDLSSIGMNLYGKPIFVKIDF